MKIKEQEDHPDNIIISHLKVKKLHLECDKLMASRSQLICEVEELKV